VTSGSTVFTKSLTASSACSGSTCSFTSTTPLTVGHSYNF
jgi:hypothetical protein